MRKTLLSRFCISFLIVGIAIYLFLNTYGSNSLNKKLTVNKIEFLYKEAHLISSEYMANYYNNYLTPQELETQLRAIETFIGVRSWIVDGEGVVQVDSSITNSATNHNINIYDPNFLELSVSHDSKSLYNFFNEPMISIIQPVSYQYRVRGYIVLHIPLASINNEATFYLNILNISYLILMLILLVTFLYLYRITAFPMKKLIRASKAISSSNYDFKLDKSGLVEYVDLSNSLSYMANELKSLDDYQKNFIGNISHDFRSPLTSIKGYAEAILDGTIPHEVQDKYLEIILFETNRLNKLTSSLLELNRFENRRKVLNIISFDINAMIKTIAESFEGTCNARKISFNLVFAQKETYVDSDMDQIQQVLYNLIDNAIKFSHNDSKIKISTDIKGEKVFISVKDYGVGIPKESLNKLWDRFYKTDTSRGKDKIGTGLGLSIAKEIVQLHNENLSLISTYGVGSEFIFTLPKS